MKNEVEPEEFKISKEIQITEGFQQKLEVLNDLSVICHHAGKLLILRDLYSDASHGHTLLAMRDLGFLAIMAYSPRLTPFLMEKGALQLANGAKISGYAMKALGFGLSKAISLYVLSDLIYNTVKYAQNTNDTDAELGMIVDGAFLTIDFLVLGIEAAEAAGYITGVAAIAGPVGMIIGTALIVGLNFYGAMVKVNHIEKIVPLNFGEVIEEYARAFFYQDIESNIEELISEEQANEHLKLRATNYLRNQYQFDTFITKSGFVNEKSRIQMRADAVIDLRYR
uniref:Uncharacterized protein n=1 Tax=Romanomermis culicivorax TaxID=13658 RepID=A0A915I4N7_ROMCU